MSILALRSGTLILVSLFSKTLKSFCFQICWWWVYLMTWRLFQKRFTCTTLVIYVFIIIAGSTSPAGGLSVLETIYVFIIIAGSTSPAGGLSVLETIFHPRNEINIVYFFFFFFFFGNFHFLQTLQTILNNYTTRQNILANYNITL